MIFGLASTCIVCIPYGSTLTCIVDGVIIIDSDGGLILDIIRGREIDRVKFPDIEIEDLGNLVIFPGIIDGFVDGCVTPSGDYNDNISTTTKAAISGGVTTIMDCPVRHATDPLPLTEFSTAKRSRIITQSDLYCDVGMWGIIGADTHREWKASMKRGCWGFVAFLSHQSDILLATKKSYWDNLLQSIYSFQASKWLDVIIPILSQCILMNDEKLLLASPLRRFDGVKREQMDAPHLRLQLGGCSTSSSVEESYEIHSLQEPYTPLLTHIVPFSSSQVDAVEPYRCQTPSRPSSEIFALDSDSELTEATKGETYVITTPSNDSQMISPSGSTKSLSSGEGPRLMRTTSDASPLTAPHITISTNVLPLGVSALKSPPSASGRKREPLSTGVVGLGVSPKMRHPVVVELGTTEVDDDFPIVNTDSFDDVKTDPMMSPSLKAKIGSRYNDALKDLVMGDQNKLGIQTRKKEIPQRSIDALANAELGTYEYDKHDRRPPVMPTTMDTRIKPSFSLPPPMMSPLKVDIPQAKISADARRRFGLPDPVPTQNVNYDNLSPPASDHKANNDYFLSPTRIDAVVSDDDLVLSPIVETDAISPKTDSSQAHLTLDVSRGSIDSPFLNLSIDNRPASIEVSKPVGFISNIAGRVGKFLSLKTFSHPKPLSSPSVVVLGSADDDDDVMKSGSDQSSETSDHAKRRALLAGFSDNSDRFISAPQSPADGLETLDNYQFFGHLSSPSIDGSKISGTPRSNPSLTPRSNLSLAIQSAQASVEGSPSALLVDARRKFASKAYSTESSDLFDGLSSPLNEIARTLTNDSLDLIEESDYIVINQTNVARSQMVIPENLKSEFSLSVKSFRPPPITAFKEDDKVTRLTVSREYYFYFRNFEPQYECRGIEIVLSSYLHFLLQRANSIDDSQAAIDDAMAINTAPSKLFADNPSEDYPTPLCSHTAASNSDSIVPTYKRNDLKIRTGYIPYEPNVTELASAVSIVSVDYQQLNRSESFFAKDKTPAAGAFGDIDAPIEEDDDSFPSSLSENSVLSNKVTEDDLEKDHVKAWIGAESYIESSVKKPARFRSSSLDYDISQFAAQVNNQARLLSRSCDRDGDGSFLFEMENSKKPQTIVEVSSTDETSNSQTFSSITAVKSEGHKSYDSMPMNIRTNSLPMDLSSYSPADRPHYERTNSDESVPFTGEVPKCFRFHAISISTALGADSVMRQKEILRTIEMTVLASAKSKITPTQEYYDNFLNTSILSSSVSISHLCLNSSDVNSQETQFKIFPPLQDESSSDKLWDALRNGTIDFVTSNHAPTNPSAKCSATGDFFKAIPGTSSIQTSLPCLWNECVNRSCGLLDLSKWMCENPADFIGLAHCKGRLKIGYFADIVVFDQNARWNVDQKKLIGVNPVSMFHLRSTLGIVKRTYLRGKLVYVNQNGRTTWNNAGHLIKPSGSKFAWLNEVK